MALREEEIKSLTGLTEQEARRQLAQDGFNELPATKSSGLIAIAWEVVREPMFLLLVACGALYLVLGKMDDAALLLGFVVVMMGITIYQESKTERALEALKDLSSPRALVIRDGRRKRIAGREVVCGDIAILAEGDRVPADSILMWSMGLTCDESLLTGESASVHKSPPPTNDFADIPLARPGGDGQPFVYCGTMVVSGQGIVLVRVTGIGTEMGRIGKSLQDVQEEPTLLQKETARLVKAVFLIAVVLCSLFTIIYGLGRHDWLNGILGGLTLAMAMLPEEFPVVLTIFLAMGAWRMSKNHVLTRKTSAVETLGAATVLCTDKTGTLTQNKMGIQKLYAKGMFYEVAADNNAPLPEEFHELFEYGILASKKDPFDPMEKSLKQLGEVKLANTEHLHSNWKLIHEYPLSKELLALSHVWKSPDGSDYVISAKGAPEAVTDLCHMEGPALAEIIEKIGIMASHGLRVLGVARASFTNQANLPPLQHDFVFKFIGLIGLEDPIRPAVPAAIQVCYDAGIRVVMITGDYPKTAQNIADKIGLRHNDGVITGSELDKMSAEELQERISNVNIFARVVPEQKLLIVNALKKNGEIVAMTGDGVNDAPALKTAHIGVAMGERGTDVAREASDLVLLDDDFSSIVAAVRMGRRIFDNLKKASAYIIGVHIPIAGLSLLPIIMGWKELILLPVHVVFLELLIDPACSIVFEAENEEPRIMNRQPRDRHEPLVGKRTAMLSILQGIISLIAVVVVLRMSLLAGHTDAQSRTLAFTTLIISNLCLILTNRSWTKTIVQLFVTPNPAVSWVLGSTLIFLALVLHVPVLQQMFHFTAVYWHDVFWACLAGIFSVLWFELVKAISRQKQRELLQE